MEQKIVSFKVAKAIKEAGYWNPNTTINSQYNNACYAGNGRLYPQGCICDWEDVFPAPTYLDVWLWLWQEKNSRIEIIDCDITTQCYATINNSRDTMLFNSPEDAIIAAIDYLVDNDLIK